ncbi:unnamed protein product [Trichogramma brassicae]|uniref:HTH cro/C1-type domain-containing protein n=1 Tax=Trichogramma brassicae TaxID=86971 RepID=A0A6H5IKI1_9HYME|nr:unnamed protein product [Trichogramma brassicae]
MSIGTHNSKQYFVNNAPKSNRALRTEQAVKKCCTPLDRETEELRHEKCRWIYGNFIMQGRQAKGMIQKDLATKICEKPQIQLVINYRGKEEAQPLQPPGGKK